MTSLNPVTLVPVLQLLSFLITLHIRVDADNRADEEDGANPVIGDLVSHLMGEVLPETRHDLLLERR